MSAASSAKAQHARGACLCGKVQFEIDFPTLWCGHCHCTLCRRAHGAAFVTWVGVSKAGFRFVDGAQQVRRYASSRGAVRSFCADCGTTFMFESTRWPDEVHLTLANFTTPIDRPPEAHFHRKHIVDWAYQPPLKQAQ